MVPSLWCHTSTLPIARSSKSSTTPAPTGCAPTYDECDGAATPSTSVGESPRTHGNNTPCTTSTTGATGPGSSWSTPTTAGGALRGSSIHTTPVCELSNNGPDEPTNAWCRNAIIPHGARTGGPERSLVRPIVEEHIPRPGESCDDDRRQLPRLQHDWASTRQVIEEAHAHYSS